MVIAAFVVTLLQTAGPNRYSPLSIDEQVTNYLVNGRTPATLFARCVEQSATPPAYFWLVQGTTGLARFWGAERPNEWLLRFPSLLAFLASLVIAAGVAERFVARGTGGLAALFLACHGPLIEQAATQSRPYALGLLAGLIAGGSLLRLASGPSSIRWFVAVVLSDLCLLWTHFVFVVVIPAHVMMVGLARPTHHGDGSTHRLFPKTALIFLLALLPISLLPLAAGIVRLWIYRAQMNWFTQLPSWDQVLDVFEFLPPLRSRAWLYLVPAAAALWLIGRLGSKAGRSAAGRVPLGRLLAIWSLSPLVLLWVGGAIAGAALAQPRYMLIHTGPAMIFLTYVLSRLYTARLAIGIGVVLCAASSAPARIIDIVGDPVRHDRYWLEAAEILNNDANIRDIVLVQSGLVENRLQPIRYDDPGFQEYVTSRLSDFYLRVPLRRLALPLPWVEGDWQTEYAKQIAAARSAGGTIWLVLSSDSDVGQSTERGVIAWLEQLGIVLRTVSGERVARILCTDDSSSR
jgi:hypothetical protein